MSMELTMTDSAGRPPKAVSGLSTWLFKMVRIKFRLLTSTSPSTVRPETAWDG